MYFQYYFLYNVHQNCLCQRLSTFCGRLSNGYGLSAVGRPAISSDEPVWQRSLFIWGWGTCGGRCSGYTCTLYVELHFLNTYVGFLHMCVCFMPERKISLKVGIPLMIALLFLHHYVTLVCEPSLCSNYGGGLCFRLWSFLYFLGGSTDFVSLFFYCRMYEHFIW